MKDDPTSIIKMIWAEILGEEELRATLERIWVENERMTREQQEWRARD